MRRLRALVRLSPSGEGSLLSSGVVRKKSLLAIQKCCAALLALLALVPLGFAQQPLPTPAPSRDASALALLQSAVKKLGGSAPNDSTTTGNITEVLGSTTNTGTIKIETLGTNQSLEQVTYPEETETIIYSQGQANYVDNAVIKPLYLQRAASCQSPIFLLPLLQGMLASADVAYQDLGPDTVNGETVEHLKIWNSYASQTTDWQAIGPFTARDIWIDPSSTLPVRLSYVQYETAGTQTGIPIDVFYFNYQSANQFQYPFSVNESVNGTPWRTIQISSVVVDSGLASSNFPITLGQP